MRSGPGRTGNNDAAVEWGSTAADQIEGVIVAIESNTIRLRRPEWPLLRQWVREMEQAREARAAGGSILCVCCREWFVWPTGGLQRDETTGLPIYRCAGCELAFLAGYEGWYELRLEVNRAAMRREATLRGQLR